MIKGKGAPHMEDIQTEIEAAAGSREDVAHIVAKHKRQIFDLLQNNMGEGTDDEKILKDLEDSLEKKKTEFETDLGKSKTEIDLTKDDDIVNFRKDKINDVHAGNPAATPAENDEIKALIKDALDKIQHLDEFNTGRTLFGGKTFNISDIKKNVKLPEIAEILAAKSDRDIDKKIEKFVKGVRKTKHPFHIQHSKLYTMPDTQREASIRIALYLYCVNQLIADKKLTKPVYDKIKKVLEEQIIKEEIFKIKGIYNVKKELENVVPEHERLHDINQKMGNIDLGTETYGPAKIMKTQDLTAEYEYGTAVDIENYKMDPTTIQTNPPQTLILKNIFGDITTPVETRINDLNNFDVIIDVGGKLVKLGEIGINNKHGGGPTAEYKFEMVELSTIQAQLTPVEIAAIFPLELTVPITGIKDVKNPPRGTVGLTKEIKIKLEVAGGIVIPPPITGEHEITSSISNMTPITREEAERKAEEMLRERYEKLSRFNPDRINLFFRRQFIKERYVRQFMKGTKGLSRDEKHVSATERQQLDQEELLNRDMEITEITDAKYHNTYIAINDLCKEYVGIAPYTVDPLTDDAFKTKFQGILTKDPPLDRTKPSIMKLIAKGEMTHFASNILDRTKIFKEHQAMVYNIADYLDKNPTATDTALSTHCRPLIEKYIRTYDQMPRFIEEINKERIRLGQPKIKIDDADFYTNVLAHKAVLTQISTQTLKMKLQIIRKGEAAYKIKQKKGIITRIGNFLDNPFGKWTQKMPGWLREPLSWLRGGVKIGGIIGAGIAGGALGGPLGTALATGGAVGLKTLFGKFAHYTKEHEGQLKNQAVDIENYQNERIRLQSAVGGNKKRYLRYGFGKKAKERRHRERYVRTTHDLSKDTELLVTNMRALIGKGEALSAIAGGEQDQLKALVAESLARLEYYKKTGQNFLGSKGVDKAEEDYQNLYSTMIAGAKRLGLVDASGKIDIAAIQAIAQHKTTEDMLKVGYDEAHKRFKNKRRSMGYTKAAIMGVLSGGLSYAASSLLSHKAGVDKEIHLQGDEYNFQSGVHQEPSLLTGDFSKDMDNILNSIGKSSDIKLHITPEVDSLPASSSTYNASWLNSKIAAIKSSADYSALSPANKTIVNAALDTTSSTSTVNQMLSHAGRLPGVDTGNEFLFAGRGVETIETTIKSMATTGTSTNTLNIAFDPTLSGAAPSVPGSAGNVLERSMNGYVEIVNYTNEVSRAIPVPLIDNTFKRKEGNV